MQNRIFRQAALERLSTPERLDELMVIISPRSTLLLLPFVLLLLLGIIWATFGTVRNTVEAQAYLLNPSERRIVALRDGIVQPFDVRVGDMIVAGQAVGSLQRADGVNSDGIISLYNGIITEILIDPNTWVEAGVPLIELANADAPDTLQAILYVPFSFRTRLALGMPVEIVPAGVQRQESGYVVAEIVQIGNNPATEFQVLRTTSNALLASRASQDAFVEVRAELQQDDDDNYVWSLSQSQGEPVPSNWLADATIVIDEQSLLSRLLAE